MSKIEWNSKVEPAVKIFLRLSLESRIDATRTYRRSFFEQAPNKQLIEKPEKK